MDSEKIDQILKLTEDNHAMLKKIRGTQKTAQMFRAIYWIVIIALTFGAYVFIQPYLEKITGLYSQGSSVLDNFKNLSGSNNWSSFLNDNGTTATKK